MQDLILSFTGSALAIAVSFVTLYWKGYLSKKAENTAMIEDTEIITRIQEAVKNEFQTQMSKSNFEHQLRLGLAIDERKLIFE